MGEHIEIKDLGVYKQALKISKFAWEIYKNFGWRTKKIIGDQFIEAIDSIGANIAEGYGRYHYLDRVKFYYNARGSLTESLHWLELLLKRELIKEENYQRLTEELSKLNHSLNAYIKFLYKSKSNI